MPVMENTESAKILIISDAWRPQINGVVRTYEFLSAELEKAGHTVRVIGPADFPARMALPGYSEIELVLLPYRRLARMVEDFSPDYLHVATEGPLGWAARRYAIKHGLTYTTAYHTQFPDYVAKRVARFIPALRSWTHRKVTALIRHFHKPAGAIVVTTPSLKEELESKGYERPMHCLARGVPVELFYPGPPDALHDVPRPIALYVGRVAVEKNLEDFLAMDWPGSKVIVGEGPDKPSLQKKFPEALFAGKKVDKELASYYRSADLFAFPSRTDTFGIVLIEALASGLPVAAYNVTGPRDIITHPHLGCLHEDLSTAALEALKHADRAEDRHAHVRAHYTWPAVAQQFMDILKKVGVTGAPKS